MAMVDIDLEDYIDEIGTRYLIRELKRRNVLPEAFNEEKPNVSIDSYSKTPKRAALIDFLKLHQSATVEDIQDAVKEVFNK